MREFGAGTAARRFCLLSLVVLAMASIASPAAAGRTKLVAYVAGANDAAFEATAQWATRVKAGVVCHTPSGRGIGGACFAVRAGESTVHVDVADRTGLPVSATVVFEDSNARSLRSVGFCDRHTLDVPSGAERAIVRLETTVLRCGTNGAFATAGTIRATFT